MRDSEKLVMEWDGQVSAPVAMRPPRAQVFREQRPAPAWLWPNLLSLDAPLVAVGWEMLAARCYGVSVALSTTLCLALAVWLIYVADRVLDVRRSEQKRPEAARHRFYRAHGRTFLAPLAAGSLIGAWLAWRYLDAATFRHGLWLLGAIAAYFAAVHLVPVRRRGWFPKELAVAALFAAGCFLPVWRGGRPPWLAMILPWILFAVICWINSATIEYTEWERLRERRQDTPHPWSVALGQHTATAAICVALVAIVFVPLVAASGARQLLLAVVLGGLDLAALGGYKDRLSADAVRVLADLALLAPVVLLAFLS
jgi:hypothetical protein